MLEKRSFYPLLFIRVPLLAPARSHLCCSAPRIHPGVRTTTLPAPAAPQHGAALSGGSEDAGRFNNLVRFGFQGMLVFLVRGFVILSKGRRPFSVGSSAFGGQISTQKIEWGYCGAFAP